MNGWLIMPNTGSPNRVSAISVPQAGIPAMNDFVPSIGSSTQTYSASARSGGGFLADDAVFGKCPPDYGAHGVLGGMVGGGDRVKTPPRPLSSTLSAVRKNGRMVSPETSAKSIEEVREVHGRHAGAPGLLRRFADRILRPFRT